MPLQGAIFDLDGVIVDTAKYHYLAWKRLADDLGFTFTEKDNERLKGVSRMASLDILLEIGGVTMTPAEKEAAADKKNGWYVDYIRQIDKSELLPGAEDYLRQLREKGVKTALGSASKNAGIILENTGIKALFDAVVDGRHVTKAKPDPEVFLLAAQRLGLSPDKCAVFEDAAAGVEAALAGGMTAVGVGDPAILSRANRVISGLNQAESIRDLWR